MPIESENHVNGRPTLIQDAVSFTLVRNEEDIVEAFVRHNLKFVKRMFIADNLSTDGTANILQRLIEEGLPVTVFQDKNPAHEQSKKTTDFYRKIASMESFSSIFFIDADEFLETTGEVLPLPAGTATEIERVRFLMPPVASSRDPLLDMNYMANEPESSKAALFHAQGEAGQIRIGEGNHNIYLKGVVKERVKINVRIRHYPLRSTSQYVQKNLIGWLSMLAKDMEAARAETPIAKHWRNEFAFIMNNNAQISHQQAFERLYGKGYSRLKTPPSWNPMDFPEARYSYLRKQSSLAALLTDASYKFVEQIWKERAQARELEAS